MNTKSDFKAEFAAGLGMLLALYSRENVKELTYSRDPDGFEAITITSSDGWQKTVNITGDSCIPIMHDVCNALM